MSRPETLLNPGWARLRCFACEREHVRDGLRGVCDSCGMPLRVDYALPPSFSPASMAGRASSLWRYREMLPVVERQAVSLVEGWTPIVAAGESVWIKDEARNPTGSFKARGMSVAVSVAKALGARVLRAPSAGNAAGALAAYGAAAGLGVLVAMPDDTPRAFVEECRLYGAEVRLVPGTISDAGRWLREHAPPDAFDVSTLREPHRVEGKKTMGYELFEQFDGALPDVLVYPTGGGTGLIGMWKAWSELIALGWLDPVATLPRMVSVQVAGCAPVVKAFNEGSAQTAPWPAASTRAWGLRVPAPLGGFLCLRAIRETGGVAVAVEEAAMVEGTRALARRSGLDICPEGGAAWSAAERLRESGWIRPGESVVVFNTGTGLKYRD